MDIYVFGEAHDSFMDIRRIWKRVREIKPKVIMHELLYDDHVKGTAAIRERIRACKIGGICDPRLNLDVYQLGLDTNAELIGIDTDTDALTINDRIREREAHMVKKVKEFINLEGPIVIIVGDLHLRDKTVGLLEGKSALYEYLKPVAKSIERTAVHLREG